MERDIRKQIDQSRYDDKKYDARNQCFYEQRLKSINDMAVGNPRRLPVRIFLRQTELHVPADHNTEEINAKSGSGVDRRPFARAAKSHHQAA